MLECQATLNNMKTLFIRILSFIFPAVLLVSCARELTEEEKEYVIECARLRLEGVNNGDAKQIAEYTYDGKRGRRYNECELESVRLSEHNMIFEDPKIIEAKADRAIIEFTQFNKAKRRSDISYRVRWRFEMLPQDGKWKMNQRKELDQLD